MTFWNCLTKLRTRLQHFGSINTIRPDLKTVTPVAVTNNSINKKYLFNTLDLTHEEVETILWTAIDLKKAVIGERIIHYLAPHKINVLIERHNIEDNIAVNCAINMLGGRKNVIYMNDDQSDFLKNNTDLAKVLSIESDLILISTNFHSKMFDIIKETTKPVINMGNNYIKPIKSLSILMTLFERLGYLKGANVSLIGYPCPLFNSCMITLPTMGVNLNVSCRHGQLCRQTPRFWKSALKLSKISGAALSQHKYIQDALNNVDAVLINEKTLSSIHLQIDKKKTQTKNWYIIQNTPRPYMQKHLVEHENKNNLTFDVVENMKYLYAALLLKFLVPSYMPDTVKPNFYGNKKNVRNISNEAAAANQAFLLEKRTIVDEENLLASMEAAKKGYRETKEAKETSEERTDKHDKETTEQETKGKKVKSLSIVDKILKKTLFNRSNEILPTVIIDDEKLNVKVPLIKNINPSVISPFLKKKKIH